MIGASYYEDLLDSLYTSLEALTATDYAWQDSDGWHRGYYEMLESDTIEHLQAGIALGGVTDWGRSQVTQEGGLVFLAHLDGSQDSLAQARIQAAMEAAMEMLTVWRHPSGARTSPTGSTVEALSPEWARVVVTFSITYPRG